MVVYHILHLMILKSNKKSNRPNVLKMKMKLENIDWVKIQMSVVANPLNPRDQYVKGGGDELHRGLRILAVVVK